MANAAVQITIKPFTDPAPTPVPASGSGVDFKYAYFCNIKELQTTALTDMSSGVTRLSLTPPQNPVSTNYVRGVIGITGSGKLKLHITVVDDATSPVTYPLAGLLFTPRDLNSTTQFPDYTCNKDGSIDLDDAKTVNTSFTFLLLVQNSAGGVAVIDPQISNQP